MYNVTFLSKVLKTLVLALIWSVDSYIYVTPNTGCSQSTLCSEGNPKKKGQNFSKNLRCDCSGELVQCCLVVVVLLLTGALEDPKKPCTQFEGLSLKNL